MKTTVEIEVYNTPIADITGDPLFGCSPFDAPMFNFVNSDTYYCKWDFGDGTIVYDCETVRNTYGPGQYDVRLWVYSENDCVDSITEFNFVQVDESPRADFRFSPQTVTVNRNNVDFTNMSSGHGSSVWDFGDESGLVYAEDPTHQFPDIANAYSITLAVENNEGTCIDTIRKTIIVEDEVIFYVPNSFTPNNSGHNDFFLPVITSGIDIYHYKLTVFNRWGELVFMSYDPSIGWDGSYNGDVQDGTYIWQIDYEVINKDKRETVRGTVSLLR